MGTTKAAPPEARAVSAAGEADAPADAPALEGVGLGRRYGKRWAVRGLDLVVPAGSVTALLGRNGVGKSTTLQMLVGLVTPSEGRARVLGHDPLRLGPSVFREVAYVSEKRELPGDLSVARVADLVAGLHGARFDRARFEELRARYKLDPALGCAALSEGQQARLLIALAVAARPRVLVLDEPTSGLDVIVRDDILEAIAGFVADAPDDAPRAVLLSTHLLEDVGRICDRAVVLREGAPPLSGELHALRAQVGAYVVHLRGVLDGPMPALPPGVVLVERDPRALTVVASGPGERVEAAFDSALPVVRVERRAATLKEAFVCWTEPQVGPQAGEIA
jgi:ABC-2 type transport system ATP-binding protein